jgi:hypothetical protein
VRFVGDHGKTGIEFDGESAGSGGYHCERVVRHGASRTAPTLGHNLEVAIVKCALVARTRKWLGTVAHKGPCDTERP